MSDSLESILHEYEYTRLFKNTCRFASFAWVSYNKIVFHESLCFLKNSNTLTLL